MEPHYFWVRYSIYHPDTACYYDVKEKIDLSSIWLFLRILISLNIYIFVKLLKFKNK